ncbi:MAG TPA: GDSL-type esterase/lipase family protein [Planctomycetota bacterium]|nr:GDSL-type esterase/lipase family protein [Planctomycetota bacterium]
MLLLVVLTFVIAEIATRALTHAGDSEMAMIGRFTLLPLRPERAALEKWQADRITPSYVVEDPLLGWTIKPGGSSDMYQANSQGLRAAAERSYSAEIPAGKVRVLALGDSFTHGDEVGLKDSWPHLLESKRDDLEVLNLGVPGYATDQALLRWENLGQQFRSDIVILAIWPEDICRNLNLVRFYLTTNGMFNSKPRFVTEASGLRLINSPVIQGKALVELVTEPGAAPILKDDAWYSREETMWKPYQHLRSLRCLETLWNLKSRRDRRQRMYDGRDPSAIDITVAIAERFREEVRASGATPMILLIPMRDLRDLHREENGFPLVRALRAKQLDVIDLGPPIVQAMDSGTENLFLPSGHMTPAGNHLLAQELDRALEPWIAKAKARR